MNWFYNFFQNSRWLENEIWELVGDSQINKRRPRSQFPVIDQQSRTSSKFTPLVYEY
jgi:hypothetical protein